jgi:kynurenine formamidase
LVLTKHVQQFERQHRPLHFGDVVLFRSDYTDRYYRPFPVGQRYISDILDGKAPGYPNPDPACMEFLATRNVMTLGTDSASMGPLPDLAEPTHYAGLKHGMIWTEAATNLGSLPSTGAFYIMLYPRHKDGAYSEGRAFAIAGGTLPARLIASATAKRAVDLSPVMAQGYPLTSPGSATGRHRQVYLDVNFLYSEYLDMWHHTHLLDSMAGTHLVPPSFSLPASEKPVQYAPHIRGWLEEYEKKFGKRGTSSMTTEKVPLEWTCGEARVIDVRHLVGTVNQRHWPASPVVTVAHIKAYEAQHGDLKGGDIVIFQTGHIDRYYQPAPADQFLWIDPQSGKYEGWPAPNPETIFYLKDRGIRCVATDAPTLGGVDEKQALMTYWALGSNAMAGVEFLYQVDQIPANSYFLFAAVKIRDCHGGLGRAIVLH